MGQPLHNAEYRKTFTSYAGSDITATFTPIGGKPVVIGELQAITYSINREKAPIYTMGDPDPRSFTRGKRGISGSLVFTIFDRHALVKSLKDQEEARIHRTPGHVEHAEISKWDDKVDIDDETGEVTEMSRSDREMLEVQYADQIPPFDVTINFLNEYGQSAVMRILGVEILNEGQGMSVDDMSIEQSCTFVARKVEYMRPASD